MISYPIQLALQTLCLASAYFCALLFAAISSISVPSVFNMGLFSNRMKVIHEGKTAIEHCNINTDTNIDHMSDDEGCLQSFRTSSEIFSSGSCRGGSLGDALRPISCFGVSSEINGAGDVEGLSSSTSVNQQNSICHRMNSTVCEDDKRSHMEQVAYIPVRHENQGLKRLVRTRLPYYGEELEEQMFEVLVPKASPSKLIGSTPEPLKDGIQDEPHSICYDKVHTSVSVTVCSLALPCSPEQGSFTEQKPSFSLVGELPSSGQEMILIEISNLVSLFGSMSIEDTSEDLRAGQNLSVYTAQQVGAAGVEMASAMEDCWYGENTVWSEEVPQCPALVGGLFAFGQQESMDFVSTFDAPLEQMLTDADEEDTNCAMSIISEPESSEMLDVEYAGVVVAGVSTACWYNINDELAMVPEDLYGDSLMDLAVEVVPGIKGNLDHYQDDCLMYWDESLVSKASPIMAATMFSVSGATTMFPASGAATRLSVSGAATMFPVSGATTMFPASGVACPFPLEQVNITNKGATCVPQQVAEDLVGNPEEGPRLPSSPLLPGSDSGAGLPGQSGMLLPENKTPEPTTIPGVVAWLTTAPESPEEVLEGEEDDDDDEEDSDKGHEDDDEGVTLQDSVLADLLAELEESDFDDEA
ncbi:hypothetical protein PHYBLDRAFT_66457 [Phycomyces blakesleeanus NRRL 1555(-)]|uniref:Uncharacterized protein n=1 Tax=Phycomyces blakesleeanus (strain ATCC 8743b / DSM 1359 / FGSC 10004 / NBRC 33097 / NRRL 1555) TaxID=763407 RepID=A0A167LX29_PHYB8|nr:hypothetical protein PHYBLDRAFT_66457 [Phycomyces blakesleeanus NRRL 1555(-)]OAD71266.1 hypothetical protein PHYBLDRAFT_66457 [Phycomyces blakesleeanus NRRL 1555(-)]|eukprot:XP_018289306.1 hypothetical protein PHYBLDRAFT_66457 [Phycomyces blakesleeanus NRRL 1555(-)]